MVNSIVDPPFSVMKQKLDWNETKFLYKERRKISFTMAKMPA
jgi:hypothetical protein